MRYYDSSWHSGQARQGMYGSTNYRGEITFDFASKLDVANIDISQIVMTVTVGTLGGDYTKYLYLKSGSWDGSVVDDFGYTGFYDTTKSKTLSADSYSTAFSRLKAFIEGGGTTLGIYAASSRGKGSGKQYDYDYLNVTAMALELTYSWKKSTGTIGSASTGSAATLRITAGSSGYKHKVTWALGSNTAGPYTIAAGTATASYTIPHSWLPNAVSGTATVTLETLNGSTSLGSNTYSFKVTVPSSVKPSVPSGSVTAAPVYLSGVSNTAKGWGLYIQNKSKAKITVDSSLVTAGSGATVRKCAVSCAGVGSGTGYSYTSPTLTKSGSFTFTATVTDSRGRTASRSVSVTVQAYAAPKFTATPTAYRCNSSGTRQETTGTYAKVTASFSCSSVNGQNSLTVKKVSLNGTDTTLASGTAAIIGTNNLALDTAYTAVITLTDAVGSTTTYNLAIPSAAYLIHFKKGGKSMGLGRAAGDSNDSTIHIGWNMDVDPGHVIRSIGGAGVGTMGFIVQNADGTNKLSLVLGADGSNYRGLYDNTNGKWMIFATDDATRVSRPLIVTDELSGKHLNVGNASGMTPTVRFRGAGETPLTAIQGSPSYRRFTFLEYPTDYDADNHAYTESFNLPQPDTGRTASGSFSILTSKSPVTVGQGGTNATTAANARLNLGIQAGEVAINANTVPAGGYLELSVTFPTAFSAAPNVVVGLVSDSAAGAFGSVSVAAYDIKKTGFKIRAYNAGSTSRTPGYQWIAVGKP